MSLSFSREHPPLIEQDKNLFTCWAATITSWVKAVSKSPAKWFLNTQQDAIDNWADKKSAKKGLNIKEITGLQLMAAGVGMDLKIFKPANKLTGAFAYEKLKLKGHLWLFYAGGNTGLSNELGHAVVIYKVSNPFGKDCTVGAMDPWPGVGYREDWPLSFYQNANECVVGWPE